MSWIWKKKKKLWGQRSRRKCVLCLWKSSSSSSSKWWWWRWWRRWWHLLDVRQEINALLLLHQIFGGCWHEINCDTFGSEPESIYPGLKREDCFESSLLTMGFWTHLEKKGHRLWMWRCFLCEAWILPVFWWGLETAQKRRRRRRRRLLRGWMMEVHEEVWGRMRVSRGDVSLDM